jgi:Na+/H+ antiporter NhaA
VKTGSLLAVIVFVLVAIAHLLRIIGGVEITVGETSVPQWVSVGGVIVPGLIAFLLWKESK